MCESIGTVSFPDLSVSLSSMNDLGVGSESLPRTNFEIEKEDGQFKIYYNEADESFYSDTREGIIKEIQTWLENDPITEVVGEPEFELCKSE